MKKILLLILAAGTWYLAAMYESRLLLGISMTGIIGMLVFFVLPKIQIRLFSAAFSEPVSAFTVAGGLKMLKAVPNKAAPRSSAIAP